MAIDSDENLVTPTASLAASTPASSTPIVEAPSVAPAPASSVTGGDPDDSGDDSDNEDFDE